MNYKAFQPTDKHGVYRAKKDFNYFSSTDKLVVEEPSIKKTFGSGDDTKKERIGSSHETVRHVTVEITKKFIKKQIFVEGLAIAASAMIAAYGNTTVGFSLAAIAIGWLAIAIPIQRWWHHG